MKQSVTVGAQLLWSGRYGCNNGCYGCTIVMSYIEINKAVSQWLLTFNLCVSVNWPLTCAFHIPCTHTPEIIDMHRGMCDNIPSHAVNHVWQTISNIYAYSVTRNKCIQCIDTIYFLSRSNRYIKGAIENGGAIWHKNEKYVLILHECFMFVCVCVNVHTHLVTFDACVRFYWTHWVGVTNKCIC